MIEILFFASMFLGYHIGRFIYYRHKGKQIAVNENIKFLRLLKIILK